jgi:hypothetical protein
VARPASNRNLPGHGVMNVSREGASPQLKMTFDISAEDEVRYVAVTSCHNKRAQTFNRLRAWPLRAELDDGRLNVEPAQERFLTENTWLSAYFERTVKWQALNPVSTQNEGSSQYAIENK